ncbi:PepSY-associated TM helix domain-containing protein [Desulfosarcina cetonica]|uniref:PepSY-associated TM helix domain-containing protein n=1 Tax=Desulfosarcina cetonica TaxID=90730 RepID=UPI0006CF2BE9|nr:PepSY-associated TM helix domain-containing protein [Desulfosarcina cetonica]
MAISGVLLNHPLMIRGISVPPGWLPPGFRHVNWDRMAMREVVFSPNDRSTMMVGGRAGVWQSRDGGHTFSALGAGFPSSAYDRDTFCLLLTASSRPPYLYAGTRSGLYRYDFKQAHWQAIDRDHFGNVEIVDLVQRKDQLLVWTGSGCYILDETQARPVLHPTALRSDTPAPVRAPLTRLLLRLHDGSVLGVPGKLMVDGVGLLLGFLSFSAIFIWFIPWRNKHLKTRGNGSRLFRSLHMYHRKVGIWAAVLLAIIALTGVFIRPPFRQTIAGSRVPAGWLGKARSAVHGWERIDRAVYLAQDDSILIATDNGFFKGPADFSRPFEKLVINLPVGGMGLDVLDPLTDGRLLMGSFRGLYVWDPATNAITNIRGRSTAGGHNPGKSVDRAVGAAIFKGELLFWADYREGLKMVRSDAAQPVMPPEIAAHAGLSLWHVLFLIHNGRIFQDWIGNYTGWIVPIGGIALVIVVLSGSYDWLHRKGVWRKKKKNGQPRPTPKAHPALVKRVR